MVKLLSSLSLAHTHTHTHTERLTQCFVSAKYCLRPKYCRKKAVYSK